MRLGDSFLGYGHTELENLHRRAQGLEGAALGARRSVAILLSFQLLLPTTGVCGPRPCWQRRSLFAPFRSVMVPCVHPMDPFTKARARHPPTLDSYRLPGLETENFKFWVANGFPSIGDIIHGLSPRHHLRINKHPQQRAQVNQAVSWFRKLVDCLHVLVTRGVIVGLPPLALVLHSPPAIGRTSNPVTPLGSGQGTYWSAYMQVLLGNWHYRYVCLRDIKGMDTKNPLLSTCDCTAQYEW
ncbi:hypothetical protein V8C42DRAFT_304379 [Trichoderma barbatum]